MLALFLSIFLFVATITSGILFLGMPYYESTMQSVKGVTIAPSQQQLKKIAALLSPSITEESNTAAISPTLAPYTLTKQPTSEISITPSPTPSAPTITATPTKTPTPKPTAILPSSTLKPSPTIPLSTPTPTSLPTPTLTPFPTTVQQSTPAQGLDANILFGMVNDYRSNNGLSTLQKDETTCSIAQTRAPQVYDEIFVTNNMHAGFTALHLSYWATENIIYYHSEQDAFNWWINDTLHRNVILGNYKYSCTACYGYSCSQVFTNYIPK